MFGTDLDTRARLLHIEAQNLVPDDQVGIGTLASALQPLLKKLTPYDEGVIEIIENIFDCFVEVHGRQELDNGTGRARRWEAAEKVLWETCRSFLMASNTSLESAEVKTYAAAHRWIKSVPELRAFSFCSLNAKILPEGICVLTQLTKLDLGRNRFSESSLKGLASFRHLQVLDLSWSPLQGCSFLTSMISLTALNLCSTELKTCKDLQGLTQLVTLDLSGNAIEDFGPLSSLMQLRSLSLASNGMWEKLNKVPSELAALPLKELDLSNNPIRDFSVLARLTGLTKLFLDNCSLIVIPEEVGSLTRLEEVSLNDNGLTECNLLDQLPALKCVSIMRNRIDNYPRELMSRILEKNLNLFGNPCTIGPRPIVSKL